jgi:hypothetical protein
VNRDRDVDESTRILSTPGHLVLGTLRLFRILKIDGRRQLAITTHCVHTFLDAHLKQAGASPLNLSLPLYPELEIVH